MRTVGGWWRWLVTPSGGPYADAGLVKRFLIDAPIAAHPMGGIAAVTFSELVADTAGMATALTALAFCFVWQWSKRDTIGAGYGWMHEVVPRLLLGLIPIVGWWVWCG